MSSQLYLVNNGAAEDITPNGGSIPATPSSIAGEGLKANAVTGKVDVDLSTMSSAMKDNLLKEINVPKWLTENTNFYVNGSTGSDTLDSSRGMSESKPFQTIQAAVDYICMYTKYFGQFTATINVAPGNYNSGLILHEFGSDRGHVKITSPGTITIARNSRSATIQVHGGRWEIENLKVAQSFNLATLTSGSTPSRCVHMEGGELILSNFDISMTYTGALNAGVTNTGTSYLINLETDSKLFVYSGSLTYKADNIGFGGRFLIRVYDRSRFIMQGGNVDVVMKNCAKCAAVDRGSSFETRGAATFTGTIEAGTCQRYTITNNSSIQTNGQGESFLPGTTAGSVATAECCFYS